MKRLLENPLALWSATFLALLGIAALFGIRLSPHAAGGLYPDQVLLPPGAGHWFGTDRLGRDLLARSLAGARVSLVVGLSATLLAGAIGFFYGALSGLLGGRTDALLMRLVDAFYGLPDLLLVILLSLVLGSGPLSVALALGLVGWLRIARITRGEVLRIKAQPYYESALALGTGLSRRLFTCVLPNLSGPLLVALTLSVPSAILGESVLSFIGLGINDPYSPWGTSWGTLARSGWQGLRTYPYLLFFPSAAIFLTTLAFNLLGDFLRDRA